MARIKPGDFPATPAPTLAPPPAVIRERAPTLAERLEHATRKHEACGTIAESCYWQGAIDAINAYSTGAPMPDVIGAGVASGIVRA